LPPDPAHHPFTRALAGGLARGCGLRGPAHLLVATSGGADSTALLTGLATLAGRRRWALELTVAHVQHHLREDAETDARFVKALAETLELPVRRADLDPARLGGPGGDNLEDAARRARYAALGRLAEDEGATGVVTGHHGDDQLETLLLRLLRGAGARGLGGMPWRRPLMSHPSVALLRPMLATDRALARAFLEATGRPWREDPTNRDLDRDRARLRREVLPALRAIEPAAGAQAVRLADRMRSIQAAIEAAADQAEHAAPGPTLPRRLARQLPAAVLAELFQRHLARLGAPRDRLGERQLAPLLAAAADRRGGQRVFHFARGVQVTVTGDLIQFERENGAEG